MSESEITLEKIRADNEGTFNHERPERPIEPADALQEFLLSGIANGSFFSKNRIPTERELAVKFGMARHGIRKVLNHLYSQGKITRMVGRGTFVADSPHPSEAKITAHFSPADIVQARLALEPGLADLVAVNATRDDFEEMDHWLECAGASSISKAEFKEFMYKLHHSIAKATKNSLLARIFSLILAAKEADGWDLDPSSVCSTSQGRFRYLEENRRIVEALKARDAVRAKKLLYSHLVRIHSTLVGGENPGRDSGYHGRKRK